MTEGQFKDVINKNTSEITGVACEAIRDKTVNIHKCLAELIASLCMMDVETMMSDDTSPDVAQARYLLWYAQRYVTDYTYEKIGKISGDMFGRTYTRFRVSRGVNSMHMLIEQKPVWNKRWNILKTAIKEYNAMICEPPVPITITIPKNVELTIKKE